MNLPARVDLGGGGVYVRRDAGIVAHVDDLAVPDGHRLGCGMAASTV